MYLKQVINQPGVEILLLEAIRNSFWNAPEMLIISSSANELGIVFRQFFKVNEFNFLLYSCINKTLLRY